MIGRNIGPYEVLAKLGEGGMGEVFRARDTRLGRDVALKILPPDVTNEPGRLERFDREARVIAALNHPHIVTIYSTEEADGLLAVCLQHEIDQLDGIFWIDRLSRLKRERIVKKFRKMGD